jgi:hypothetical protein
MGRRPLQELIELARRDPDAALARARADGHAGNRCHFLAWVAHLAGERRLAAIAREALATCDQIENAYHAATLAAWPLRALAEGGREDECERALPGVLARVRALEKAVNRIDALERVFHGVFPAPRARRRVLIALIAECREAATWKAPRCLANVAAALAGEAEDRALVLAALPEGRQRRRAERELAAGAARAAVFFS